MGKEAAFFSFSFFFFFSFFLGGAMLFGIGLSGSDRDDNVSNLLDISREAVASNKDVEKLGIPHRMHSNAILLLKDQL